MFSPSWEDAKVVRIGLGFDPHTRRGPNGARVWLTTYLRYQWKILLGWWMTRLRLCYKDDDNNNYSISTIKLAIGVIWTAWFLALQCVLSPWVTELYLGTYMGWVGSRAWCPTRSQTLCVGSCPVTRGGLKSEWSTNGLKVSINKSETRVNKSI